MKILIVEDERSLAAALRKGLEEEGYSVVLAFDGEEGLYLAENEPADLLILDLMLPAVDGFTILKTLRKHGKNIPVLVLTARDTITDKVSGLDSGADDYLTKPFTFEELLARVRALLRRKSGSASSIVRVGDLSIDMATHKVRRGEKEIAMPAREYEVLEYLGLNKNKIVTRSEISEHVYDYASDFDSNLIDVCVHRLRRKIDGGFPVKLLQTVRGAGYLLKE